MRFRKMQLIAAALAGSAALVVSTRAFAGAFVDRNTLAVVRLGDGSAPLGVNAAAAYVDQYDVSGPTPTLLNTVALPSAGAGALTMSAVINHDGLLNYSTDGRYLTVAGYRYDSTGAADPATLTTAAAARVIGRVGMDGSVDTSTTITDAYNSLAVRAAASTDGAHFWVAGDGTGPATAHVDGLRYVGAVGGSTSVDMDLRKPDTTVPPYENVRSVSIFGGQLYITSGSNGSIGKAAFKAGTGLQTSGPTQLSIVESADSTNAVFFADLNATQGVDPLSPTGGMDTLYATTSDTLRKFSYVGGTWVAQGTAALTGVESVTALVNGSNVTVFASRANGIFRLTDGTGYNATMSSTFGGAYLLPGTNQEFRGVAAVPEPGIATALLGTVALVARWRNRRET